MKTFLRFPSLLRSRLSLLCVAGGALLPAGCSAGYGHVPTSPTLRIAITAGPLGSATARLPITFDTPNRYTVTIESIGPNGTRDTSDSGFVRLSTKPGSVVAIGGDGARGRNIALQNGVIENVTVDVAAAYGDTRIWVEALNYVPGDALNGKPECSDGIDNDNDGLIDFPADPGCEYADDDTEDSGNYATAVSDTLFYAYPRVADVRGVSQGGAATPFPKSQIQVDTGYDRDTNVFNHNVVVTRIAADGFYITDIDDPRGYSSVLAYTFNPPTNMRICDRLVTFSGTAADFYGFTEINFPAWSVEERVWDGSAWNRPCLIPEPHTLTLQDLGDLRAKLSYTAALVRVESVDPIQTRIASHFGNGKATLQNGTYVFTKDASNCDFNDNSKIDFTRPDEAACSTACDADNECAEWSAYAARSDFDLVIEKKNAAGSSQFAKIIANASSAPDFDVLANRGVPLRAFSGTLRYFSGGSQFTIEARCQDDIVTDLTKDPISSEQACVFQETSTDNNAGATQ